MYRLLKKLEQRVHDGLGILLSAVGLFSIIWMMHRLGVYHESEQIIEAFVIAIAGVISSYNYTFVGRSIKSVVEEAARESEESDADVPPDGVLDAALSVADEEFPVAPVLSDTQKSAARTDVENELFQNLLILLNVAMFAIALYLLKYSDRPFLSVLGIYLIFSSFVAANMIQSGRLNDLFRAIPCNPQATGALLIKVSDLLAGENGPSMFCYSILVAIAVVAEHLKRTPKDFGTFASGAATFHLSVSVLSFLSKFRNNPFEHTVEHVDWKVRVEKVFGKSHLPKSSPHTKGPILKDHVAEMVIRSGKFWVKWALASVMIVLLASCFSCWERAHPAAKQHPSDGPKEQSKPPEPNASVTPDTRGATGITSGSLPRKSN